MKLILSDIHTLSKPRRAAVLLCLAVGLLTSASTYASDTSNPDAVAQPIDFLVIEGELLTGGGEGPSPNVISILQKQSAREGDASDFVLEHSPTAELADGGDPRPEEASRYRSYTIWKAIDPAAATVSRSNAGRTLDVIVDTGNGLYLAVQVESDQDAIEPGLYGDGDSWFRVNVLEEIDDGEFALDIEYSVPAGNAAQSGRLRLNTTSREKDSPFSIMTEAEWLNARPGGVAYHWVQYGESAAVTPPSSYFGEQFSDLFVLSPEEARRLVAPDREKLESRGSGEDQAPDESQHTDRNPAQRESPKTRSESKLPSATKALPRESTPSSTDTSTDAGGLAFGPPRPAGQTTDPPELESSRSEVQPRLEEMQPSDSNEPSAWLREPAAAHFRGHSTGAVESHPRAADPSASQPPAPPTPPTPPAQTLDQRRGAHLAYTEANREAPNINNPDQVSTRAARHPARPVPWLDPSRDPPHEQTLGQAFDHAFGYAFDLTRASFRDLLRRALDWWWEERP